jgi:hypothetical protein
METIQAQNELVIIRKIMEDSRRIRMGSAKPALVWGVLVFAGILFSYLNAFIFKLNMNELYLWCGIMAAGWVYQLYYIRSLSKEARVKTFSVRIIRNLWNTTLLSLTIVFFSPWVNSSFPFQIAVGVIALLLGNAFYVDGVICESNLIKYCAAGWWVGGIVIFFAPGMYKGLIFAGLILFFQIIPGIILYRRWKKDLVADYA